MFCLAAPYARKKSSTNASAARTAAAGRSFVVLEESEIASIARFLGVEEPDFIQRYTRLRPERDGLALVDKGPATDGTYDHACVFLEGRDCRIQPVKPLSMRRLFRTHGNFPGWREECEAVPRLRKWMIDSG